MKAISVAMTVTIGTTRTVIAVVAMTEALKECIRILTNLTHVSVGWKR
jgi:hypothetical protein